MNFKKARMNISILNGTMGAIDESSENLASHIGIEIQR